jgi:hypothetical protein
MAYRELSKDAFYKVVNYFFSQGFDPDITRDKVAQSRVLAQSNHRSVIDVFRDAKEKIVTKKIEVVFPIPVTTVQSKE